MPGAEAPDAPPPMDVTLREAHLAEIVRHAEETYPEEACGFLLGPMPATPWGTRRVDEVRRATNVQAAERSRRYVIAPEEIRRTEEELEGSRRTILGFYHSHPDHPAHPSEFDRGHAWPWYAYLVLRVERGKGREIRAFELTPDGMKFEERALKVQSHTEVP